MGREGKPSPRRSLPTLGAKASEPSHYNLIPYRPSHFLDPRLRPIRLSFQPKTLTSRPSLLIPQSLLPIPHILPSDTLDPHLSLRLSPFDSSSPPTRPPDPSLTTQDFHRSSPPPSYTLSANRIPRPSNSTPQTFPPTPALPRPPPKALFPNSPDSFHRPPAPLP